MSNGFDASKYAQGDWLKGEDLEEGERTIVTIKSAYEHVFEQSGDKRPVIEFFELDQKLSLNKSRVKKLIDLFGPDTSDWIGQTIALYAVDVNFNGQVIASVAIARAPALKSKPKPAADGIRPGAADQDVLWGDEDEDA